MDIKEIVYKEIKTPLLNDATYGETIAKNFEIINDNFKRLSSIDFIKGAPGTSVFIEEIDLLEEVSWRDALKASIIAMEDKLGGTNEIDDKNTRFSILDKNPGKLYMIYEQTPELNDKKYISSLPYVFLDGRFANKKLTEKADQYAEEYSKMVDYSCVLNFSTDSEGIGKFVALQNFPTLYYDRDLGFCWNINGQETGISAQGPKGIDGDDGELFIVKADENDNFKVVCVMDVLSGGWVNVKEHININKRKSVAAIVVPRNSIQNGNLKEYPYWITSVVRNNDGNYYATNCVNTSRIAVIIDDVTFDNILSNISSTNAGVKGLFLPMKSGYHMVYTEDNNTYIKPVLDKNSPMKSGKVNGAKLIYDYDDIEINGSIKSFSIKSPQILSGDFANNDRIVVGKDGRVGSLSIISSDSDDLIKQALNSSDGMDWLIKLLIKYDLININRYITTPLKLAIETTGESYWEKRSEVPNTNFYTPAGNFNVQNTSLSYAAKTGEASAVKSTKMEETSIVNGSTVKFLKWERIYESQKVYELRISGTLTGPVAYPSPDNPTVKYSVTNTYMFDLVLDIYIDKFHFITYKQDPDKKGNVLNTNGEKIISNEYYEYDLGSSVDNLMLKTFEQILGAPNANEPAQLSYDEIVTTIKDEVDYDK